MAQKNLISRKYSEDELRRIFEQFKKDNFSCDQMCEALSISARTVGRYLKKFGLSQNNKLSLSVETVARLYDDGLTANEIAKKYDVSHDAITRRLRKAGREINRANNIEKHFVRAHDKLWNDIEYDLNSGMSKTAICSKYHLRPENFEKLVRRNQYCRTFVGDISEIKSILAAADDLENPKARTAVKLYMNAILDYVNDFKSLPTITTLSQYMNISVQTVAWWFKQHSYTKLLSRHVVSPQVSIVEKVLSDLLIAYEVNNRKLISPYEIDIWLYDLNIGIEVNPSTAHCSDTKRRMHKSSNDYHQQKALLCWHKNIRLIQLYDWDIFQSDIKGFIASLLIDWTNFGNIKEVIVDLDKPFCRESDLLSNGFVETAINPPTYVSVNANTNKITDEQTKQTLHVYNAGSIVYTRI